MAHDTLVILDIVFSLLPQDYTVDLAIGNINPKENGNVTNTFPRPAQVKIHQLVTTDIQIISHIKT